MKKIRRRTVVMVTPETQKQTDEERNMVSAAGVTLTGSGGSPVRSGEGRGHEPPVYTCEGGGTSTRPASEGFD